MAGGEQRFRGLSGRAFAVPPEYALLYRTANPRAPAGRACLEPLLQQGLDWQEVVDLADRHGVAALLRRALREAGAWTEIPPAARQELEHRHQRQRLLYLGLAHQLGALLAPEGLAPLRPVVLKGAALAAAYPDPSLRPMSDVDLLVAEAQVDPADAALCRLGYAREGLYYSDEFNRQRGYHYRYGDPLGHRLSVELHWDLASRLERRNRLSAAMLLRRSAPDGLGALPGRPTVAAHVLAPPARVVYLATHAATEGHALSRLIWLSDLAVTCADLTPAEWRALVALAGRARARAATSTVLALARHLIGATVPEAVLAELRPPAPQVLLLERALTPATLLAPLDDRRRAAVKYLVVDSPATSARLLAERLLPPPAVMRVYAPDGAAEGLPRAYLQHAQAIGRAGIQNAAALLGGLHGDNSVIDPPAAADQ